MKVVWTYPACHTFTQIESDEVLELVEETIAVPRTLLEDIGAMLCHNKFREHDALRTAIGLLLEPRIRLALRASVRRLHGDARRVLGRSIV